MKKHIKKYIIITIVLSVILGSLFYWFKSYSKLSSNITNKNLSAAIKSAENDRPKAFGDNPTKEEIFDSPYIKQIQRSLNNYLNGTNVEVEDYAISSKNVNNIKCGLDSFSKDYYKSKFIILEVSNYDYGGVIAYIVFINKPDKIFMVWIYDLASGEYELRSFCEKNISEEDEIDFKVSIDNEIKNTTVETYNKYE